MAGLANPEARRTSAQRLLWLGSGLLVTFAAVGFGAWLSGAASWVGFYLGARGGTLTGLAQATICVGFGLAVLGTLAWYRRRCGRGATDIPARAVLAACLAMPAGNISWAIFVDAVAYHYGEDIVRPAVDFALMYLVLGALPPLALGVPWLVWRLRRAAPTSESPPVPA